MAAELAIIAKLQDEASGGIRALRGEIEAVEPSTGVAARGFANLQTIGAASLAALATAAVAVGAAIGSSIGVAAEFQDSVTILAIAAKGAGESFDSMRAAAMAVGADTSLVGVNAAGAAEAMTTLYKAGMTTGEIFGDLNGYLAGNVELSGALRAAIDGAAASELSMDQAAMLAATSLATFGSEMTTTEERAQFVNMAMNNFVQAADASMASVADLAAAMATIGPTAAQFGFSLQDTNTALAILSTRGIMGSEAGTALKSMFNNLMETTPKTTAALNELGVTLYNTDGTMRSMPAIIGDLSQALYGMNEVTTVTGGRTAEQNHQLELAQKSYDQATDAIYKHTAGLKTLTDSQLQKYRDQQAAANAEIERLSGITGTATTAVRQMTEEQRNQYIATLAGSYGMKAMAVLLMEGTAGWEAMEKAIASAATIQEVAAARTQTFSGAMEALTGVIETIRIGIGSAFLPVLTSLARALAELASENMDRIVGSFEAVGAAIASFFDAIMGGTPPIQAFVDAVGQLATALGMPAEKVVALKATLDGLLAVIGGILGPIAQAITSFISWKDVLGALAIAIGSALLGMLAALVQAFGPIIATFAAVVLAVAALRTAWENDFLGIRTAVEGFARVIGDAVGAVAAFVQGDMVRAVDLFRQLPEPVQAVVNAITSFIDTLRDSGSVGAAFLAGLDALKRSIFDWAGTSDWGEIGSMILDKIAAAFSDLGSRAAEAAANILNWISTSVNSIDWNAVGQAIVNGITAAIVGVVGLLAAAGTAIASFITSFFTNDSLQAAGTSIVTAIGNAISGAVSGISSGLDNIRQAIFDWAGADSWGEVGSTIIDRIAETFRNLGDKVAEVEAGLFNWIASAVDGIDWRTVGESIINGIVAAISAVVGLLVSAGTAIVNYFIGFFTNEEIGPAAENLISSLSNAIGEFAGGIVDGLENIQEAIFDWAGAEDWSGVAETIIEMVGEALADAADAIGERLEAWREAIFDWAGAEDWSGVAETIIEMVGTALADAADAIGERLEAWEQAIFDWAEATSWVEVGLTIAESVGEAMIDAVGLITEQLGEWEQAIFDWADAADWIEVGQTIVEKAVEGLTEWADAAADKVEDWFDAVSETIDGIDWYQIGYDIVYFIVNGLVEFATAVGEKVTEWYTAIKTLVEGKTWTEIAAIIIAAVVGGLANFATGAQSTMDLWVAELKLKAVGALAALGELGSSIVTGVISGLQAAKDGLATALVGIVQGAIDAAKAALGIQSPSRVAAEQIGVPFSTGIALGITQATGAVIDSVRQLASAIELEGVKAFGEAMKAIAEGVAAALSAILDIGSFGGAADGFGAAMQALVDLMASMVAAVAEANTYTVEVLENLGTFVEAAGDINDLLVQTADVVDYIGRWRAPDLTAVNGVIATLIGYLAQMVQGIAGMNLEAMLILGALGDFLDAAAELPALFMGVADIVSYLAAWRAPALGPVIDNVNLLAGLLGDLVTAIAGANTMGLGMLDILGAFIETAEGVVGLIAPLADAMLDIANFPQGAEFGVMQRNIETMATYLGQIVTAVAGANTMGALSLENLGTFVEVAGEIVDLIAPMAQAMLNIANFPPGTEFGVMQRNIETMAGYLHELVAAVAESNTWGQLTLELLGAFVEVAGQIAELIVPMTEAIWNITNFQPPNWFAFIGNLATLAGHLNAMVVWFYSGLNLSQAALEALGQYIEVMQAIADGMVSFIDAIAEIAAFQPPNLFAFIGNLATLAGHLNAMVVWFYSGLNLSQTALDALGQYIEVMQAIADGMVSFIDAIAAIAAFQPPDLFTFIGNVATLAGHLGTMVVWFWASLNLSQAALEALGQYVEVIGDLVDLIADAIEALGLIAAYSGDTAALGPAIAAFSADLMLLVQTLAAAFASASVEARAAILAAGDFADAVGDILGVVEDGVDALAALAGYVTASGIGAKAQQFAVDLAAVITAVVGGLQQAGILADAAIVAAGELADGLADVLGMVEDGVDAVTALAGYVPASGIGALAQQFAVDLAVVITAIIGGLQQAGILANAAVVEAGELADGLADILGVVADGVEAITALAAYVPAAGIGAAAQQFATDLAVVITTIVNGLQQAGILANAAVVAAGEMAGKLSDLLGVVADGIEAIKALAEYQGVEGLSEKVQKFTGDLVAVATILATQLTAAANAIGAGTIDAARAFATAVAGLATEVQSAVQGLAQLAGMATPNVDGVLNYIVATSDQIRTAFSTAGDIGQAVAYAAAFRANLTQLVAEVQGAVAQLNALAGTGTTGTIGAALAAIAASLMNTQGQFTGSGTALANALIAALTTGINGGQGVVVVATQAVIGAAETGGENAAREFTRVGDAIIHAIVDGVLSGQVQVVAAVVAVVAAAINAGLAEARRAAEVGREVIQAALAEVNGGRGALDTAGAAAGNAIIDGMVRAIANGKSRLVNAIKDAVAAAIAAAKAALGIASPSKVADGLMSNFMGTAANTIDAMGRDVAAAMTRAMRAAAVSAEAGLGATYAGRASAVGPTTDGLAARTAAMPVGRSPLQLAAAGSGTSNQVVIYGDLVLPGVSDSRSFLEELDALRGGSR